ncbi:MAG TPA: hypothetical protein VFP78_12960, partial [Solirubrobacteraceae bacterium]|nr:hypothetical protein [Solirubrobacteraceae bacterium]
MGSGPGAGDALGGAGVRVAPLPCQRAKVFLSSPTMKSTTTVPSVMRKTSGRKERASGRADTAAASARAFARGLHSRAILTRLSTSSLS